MNTIKTEFTEELRTYLLDQGFTYIWCNGMLNNSEASAENEETDLYFITLINPEDLNIKQQIPESMKKLDSGDIIEMTISESDSIKYIIKMPENIYFRYLTH